MDEYLAMKKLALALALLLAPSIAWAQCTGVFPNNTYCGNNSGGPAPPFPVTTGSFIIGPGSTTVGDVAIWNNTSGTLLADKPPLQIFGTIGNNLFLSGPSTGGPLNPTFRAITQADIQTAFNAAIAAIPTPTHQVLTSSSGTYTTPANTRWIEIHIVGGGGGGGGSQGSTGAGGAGGVGGNTCWNTSGAACTTPVYQAGGGTAGNGSGSAIPVAGGTVSGSGTCDWSMSGGDGAGPTQSSNFSPPSGTGGMGGITTLGGNGAAGGGGASMAPSLNSGAGGVGGSTNLGSGEGGGGGGGGATCHVTISAPAATYTYAIGAAGTAGAAGTGANSTAGTVGAAGIIIVYEHYGP